MSIEFPEDLDQSKELQYMVAKRTFAIGEIVTYKPSGNKNKLSWERCEILDVLTGADEGMYSVKFNLRSLDSNRFGKVHWWSLS